MIVITIVSAVLSLNFIILLRFISKAIIYATIIFALILLSCGTCIMIDRYSNTKQDDDYYILLLMAISTLTIALLTVFLRKRIVLACQIIQEASKYASKSLPCFLKKNTRVQIQPLDLSEP